MSLFASRLPFINSLGMEPGDEAICFYDCVINDLLPIRVGGCDSREKDL